MHNPLLSYFLRILLGAQCVATVALAQVPPPNIPGGVDPGRLQERFEAPKLPRAVDEPLLPDGEKKLPAGEAEKIRFKLTAITLSGNSIFSETDLNGLYQAQIGKEVTLATIYQIADAITAHYRTAGYVLARAAAPAQRVENGVVQIVVFEGRIGKVSIEGVPPGARAKIGRAHV